MKEGIPLCNHNETLGLTARRNIYYHIFGIKMFVTLNFFIVICVYVQNSSGARTTTLPKYLKKCKYQDPEEVLSKCLGDAMEDALKKLKNGEPSLGIQPLDPLRVSQLDILQGGNRPVSLSIHHRNLDIHGVSQCQVTENDFNKKDGTMKGKMFCPNLKLFGDYELDGRVLLLPVRGNGKSTIILKENDCSFTAHGQHVTKNGTLYEKYYKIDFAFEPKKMSLNFENLLGGDQGLGKTMNEFINENWREILNELKPSYEEVFSTVFMDTIDKVFTRVPVKNILPDYFDTK